MLIILIGFIIFILIIGLIIYYLTNDKNTIFIGGEKFIVHGKHKDKEAAAQMMNKLNRNVIRFIEHMKKIDHYKHLTDKLKYRYNPSSFIEGTKSYTLKKGKKISLCLRDNDGNIYDENLLMFVLLHEISHIAINSKDHTPEFWYTFTIILKEAVDLGIYKPVDYSKYPTMYCNIKIEYNPYFG